MPKNSMQAIHRVAKNTGILYIKMAITVFISLYATRLILNALGIEDFGLYNLVGGVIAMLGFLNGSMAAASQRFMSIAQGAGDIDKVRLIFNASTITHAGIALIVLFSLEIAGYFFFNGFLNIDASRVNTAKLVYQFMVATTLFTIISVPYDAVITSHENMLFYAVLGIAESILKLAIAFYIAYGTLNLPTSLSISSERININYSNIDNLIVYALLMAALSVFLLIVRRIYCHWKYPECEINLRKYYNKSLLKQMTGFAGWSFLGSGTSMIANYGQGIVINLFFGTAVNAAQGVANQISGQLAVFATTLITALNPMIAKSEGAGNRTLMLKAVMMGSKVSFFLMMALHIPMLIEMPFILKLWLKNVPDFAVIFCRLLLIRNLIEQLFIPVASAISAEGNIKGYQITASILIIFTLPISYVLFKIGFPAYTLYIVFILYSMLASSMILCYAKKNCQLSITMFLNNVIGRSFCSFIIVFFLSLMPYLFIETEFIRFVSVIMTSILSYLITVFFIGFSSSERIKIKEMCLVVYNKVMIKKVH